MLRRILIISFAAVAVLSCFRQSEAAAKQTATDKYAAILETLDTSNLDSLAKATRAYKKLFAGKRDVAAQEDAFDKWSNFAARVLAGELGRLLGSGIYNDIGAKKGHNTLYVEPVKGMRPETKQYLADLRKRGVVVSIAESTKIEVAFSFIKSTFFPYLSPAKQQFLTLTNENAGDIFKYGENKIPAEKRRLRIIKLESFVKQYPSSSVANDAAYLLRKNVQSYILSGVAKGLLTAGEKKSFQLFLKENGDSRYYPLMNEYYQHLETHQFRPDLEVARKLLDKYNQ